MTVIKQWVGEFSESLQLFKRDCSDTRRAKDQLHYRVVELTQC